nr:hypothetical protein [Tanacetum cinerariifolium]
MEGEEFTLVQDDDDTLTFFTDLGYKGLLYKHTNMFMDHMHQPWRTLAAISNKCLPGNTASNDKLRKSKINILWGMLYRENIDYPELIWEDFSLQIDHMKKKKSRRKSISITKVKEEEATRQVHATHAKIVIEFVPKLAKKKTSSRSTRSVVTKDTPSAPKLKLATSKPKFKGVQSLTPKEQEAVDVMQALKESKKTSRRQPGTRGLSEGTGRILGVPNESTFVSTTSSEGTEEDLSEEEEVDWIDYNDNEEKKDDTDEDKSIDLEMTKDKETDDEVLQVLIPIQETPSAAPVTTLPPPSVSTIPHAPLQQSTTPIPTPPITTDTPTITITIPESDTLSTIQLRVAKLEKDVFELKKIDHSAKALAALKSQVPTVVEQYLGSKISDDFQNRSTRSVVTEDTPSAPKSKLATSKPKFKGVQSLTPKEQEAADVMQALKESKKTSRRQLGTRGSSEGTGRIPGVPNKSTIGFEQESKYSEEDLSEEEEVDWIDYNDDEEKKDDTYEDKINDNEDEDMSNDEVEESRNDDEEATDAAKAKDGKTKKAKDDPKKAELPPTSSSLSSPSMLKVHVSMISEPSVLIPIQETPSAAPVITLPPPSVSTIPHAPLQQSTTPIPTPPITTDTPTITITIPESDTLSTIQLRVAKLEKDVSELKKIDHSAKALAALKSQVPTVVEQYLGSKISDDFQKFYRDTL